MKLQRRFCEKSRYAHTDARDNNAWIRRYKKEVNRKCGIESFMSFKRIRGMFVPIQRAGRASGSTFGLKAEICM